MISYSRRHIKGSFYRKIIISEITCEVILGLKCHYIIQTKSCSVQLITTIPGHVVNGCNFIVHIAYINAHPINSLRVELVCTYNTVVSSVHTCMLILFNVMEFHLEGGTGLCSLAPTLSLLFCVITQVQFSQIQII